MIIPPDGWVNAYLDLFVPTLQVVGGIVVGGPEIPVPITKYVNADHANQPPRSAEGVRLIHWLQSRASPARVLGTVISVPGVSPSLELKVGNIAWAVRGKATPDELRSVLRFVSLWLSATGCPPGEMGHRLRAYADAYLGVDCNGFIGTYLHTYYPAAHMGPQFYIPSVPDHSHARRTVSELKPLDLVVSQGWGHVSIIGSILSRTDSELQCVLCESRSEAYGGVHAGRVRIRARAGDRPTFTVNGRDVTGIYGLRTLENMPRWLT